MIAVDYPAKWRSSLAACVIFIRQGVPFRKVLGLLVMSRIIKKVSVQNSEL